jgi:hypothetical protein
MVEALLADADCLDVTQAIKDRKSFAPLEHSSAIVGERRSS